MTRRSGASYTELDQARRRLHLRVPPFRPTATTYSYRHRRKLLRVPINLRHVVWLAASALWLAAAPAALGQVPAPARVWMPFSHLGAGLTVGTTGVGAEIAAPYGAYWNIRAGVSYLGYSHTFQTTGSEATASPVEGHLRLGGARLGVDWFPRAGGFHISVGVWVPNLTRASARLNLEPGKTITIQGADYTTDSVNPFQGTGHSDMNPVAPLLTVGWGNLLPRDYRKRFSFPVEIGAAYVGSPTVSVTTAGDVCSAQGCSPAASDLEFNQNLNSAIRELDRNLNSYARFLPIVSAGIGYRF
jgi:hypothetical protein